MLGIAMHLYLYEHQSTYNPNMPLRDLLYVVNEYQKLDPELELKVTVLNINSGNNKELMESCRTLREYMQYVNCVRYYTDERGMNLSEAVEYAVNECIEKGIMADFLQKMLAKYKSREN